MAQAQNIERHDHPSAGGEVSATHHAAAEGSRVVIALHPRTVITALLWFERPPPAATCGAFLERVSLRIEVAANDMEPIDGLMRVGRYAADCDGGACTQIHP